MVRKYESQNDVVRFAYFKRLSDHLIEWNKLTKYTYVKDSLMPKALMYFGIETTYKDQASKLVLDDANVQRELVSKLEDSRGRISAMREKRYENQLADIFKPIVESVFSKHGVKVAISKDLPHIYFVKQQKYLDLFKQIGATEKKIYAKAIDRCPSEYALGSFVKERATPKRRAEIAAHIEGCRDCADAIEKLERKINEQIVKDPEA